MRNLSITIEKAREIYAKGDEVMNSLLLETFTKEELEEKEVKRWEDLKNLEGYCIDTISTILGESQSPFTTTHDNRNIWATKEQAEACLAMSQLSQLMKHVNGDWKPDWGNQECPKYTLMNNEGKVSREVVSTFSGFLAFPTVEIRDKFLENHSELIETAKPLL